MDTDVGFKCLNADNNPGGCSDYEVRLCCGWRGSYINLCRLLWNYCLLYVYAYVHTWQAHLSEQAWLLIGQPAQGPLPWLEIPTLSWIWTLILHCKLDPLFFPWTHITLRYEYSYVTVQFSTYRYTSTSNIDGNTRQQGKGFLFPEVKQLSPHGQPLLRTNVQVVIVFPQPESFSKPDL